MIIRIICNEEQKEELGIRKEEVFYYSSIEEAKAEQNTEVVIDLLFENSAERIAALNETASVIIINSVEETLAQTNSSFIRINGWNTFLKAETIEASGANEEKRKKTEEAFEQLSRKVEWLPDEAGFITPRIISMIINEAYFALSEGVSTKEEINTALKLGTNYPFGPFEWSEKIGLKKIASLLQTLATKQSRYAPCGLLVKEAGTA